jgi:leucyl aminopeptidase (aminopeptidase T)
LTGLPQATILKTMSQTSHHPPHFADVEAREPELDAAARIAVRDSLQVKAGEKVLIVSNPDRDVAAIARALYDAAVDAGAAPVLMFQPVKTQMDFAEAAVVAAFQSQPDVFMSLSAEKLGKDRHGISHPYRLGDKEWHHIFHYQMYGAKTCRAFWSPSTSLESFARTVPIDYAVLRRRSAAVKSVLDEAVAVRVTAPGGTDVTIGLAGRIAKSDDGDFAGPGAGGNLPAGETFISPANGTAEGVIAFDGSISLHDGDIVINEPIVCRVAAGYITDISGGPEAEALKATVALAERNAFEYEKAGTLGAGLGEIYARNARNIGELGIGLNPKATVTGNMLEDEKAFRTCHFAVGHNYDEDAPALIHLDGLVKAPTISAVMSDGREVAIERDGELTEAFR